MEFPQKMQSMLNEDVYVRGYVCAYMSTACNTSSGRIHSSFRLQRGHDGRRCVNSVQCGRAPSILTATNRRPTDDQRTTNERPTDEQQTTNGRPTDDQRTTNRRQTDDHRTTNGRQTDDQRTINGRPTDDQRTTNRRQSRLLPIWLSPSEVGIVLIRSGLAFLSFLFTVVSSVEVFIHCGQQC